MPKKTAPWLSKLSPSDRADEIAYLKSNVRLLRKYSKDFGAENGFNLHDVSSFTAAKSKKLKSYAQQLRRLESQPHKVFRPRTDSSDKAMKKFTRQRLPGQSAFIVHTDQPKKTRVRVEKGIVRKDHIIKGRRAYTESFFPLPKRYTVMEDLLEALEKILPDLPDGDYVAYSETYGPIGGRIQKEILVEELRANWLGYEKLETGRDYARTGLIRSILGFQWVGKRAASKAWEKRHTKARKEFRKARIYNQRKERYDLQRRLEKLTKRMRSKGRK